VHTYFASGLESILLISKEKQAKLVTKILLLKKKLAYPRPQKFIAEPETNSRPPKSQNIAATARKHKLGNRKRPSFLTVSSTECVQKSQSATA